MVGAMTLSIMTFSTKDSKHGHTHVTFGRTILSLRILSKMMLSITTLSIAEVQKTFSIKTPSITTLCIMILHQNETQY